MEAPAPAAHRSHAPATRARARGSLEGLAVVDDGHHVLHIAVRVLPVPQMLGPAELLPPLYLRNRRVSTARHGRHHAPADRSTPGTSVGLRLKDCGAGGATYANRSSSIKTDYSKFRISGLEIWLHILIIQISLQRL